MIESIVSEFVGDQVFDCRAVKSLLNLENAPVVHSHHLRPELEVFGHLISLRNFRLEVLRLLR